MKHLASLAALLWFLAPLAAQEKKQADKPKPPTKVELELIKLTNQARAKEQKPALQVNDVLMQAARQHAANMAKQNQMTHELDGKNPADRLKDLGYEHAGVAENVAHGQRTPLEAVVTWMGSEAHRGNILGDYTEIGVAQVKGQRGYFFVQVFGRPK